MKVLIVEDEKYKLDKVIDILFRYNIDDFDTEMCSIGAVRKCTINNYDLIILDLGMARHRDSIRKDEREGLIVLYELAYRNIIVPIVVNSSTLLTEEDKDNIKELEYPLIGQATDMIELEEIIKSFVNKDKLILEKK